jgi:hypothetical protein
MQQRNRLDAGGQRGLRVPGPRVGAGRALAVSGGLGLSRTSVIAVEVLTDCRSGCSSVVGGGSWTRRLLQRQVPFCS